MYLFSVLYFTSETFLGIIHSMRNVQNFSIAELLTELHKSLWRWYLILIRCAIGVFILLYYILLCVSYVMLSCARDYVLICQWFKLLFTATDFEITVCRRIFELFSIWWISVYFIQIRHPFGWFIPCCLRITYGSSICRN